jgi:alpha-beta hydrolase superfamily lysophospholipase
MSFSANKKAEPAGHTEWLTGKDSSEHFVRFYKAQDALAFVLYLHGIEGHSLWFEETAVFLQQNGITTLAPDRRGSGMSKERRGDMTNWQQLVDDLEFLLQHARCQAGGRPLFLMGNCWGAKLAALASECKQPASKLIAGLILSSPAINVKVDLPLADKLTVAWRFLSANKCSLAIPLQVEDFTDNPKYLEFINRDCLRLTQATAHFFVNTVLLTFKSKASPAKIFLPVLVLQSGQDAIVDTGGTKRWFDRIKAVDKTYHLFENCRHSLDFDREPDKYRQTILGWIKEHSSLKPSQDPHTALSLESPSP